MEEYGKLVILQLVKLLRIPSNAIRLKIIAFARGCSGFDRETENKLSMPKARLRKNGNLNLNANKSEFALAA